MRPAARPRDRLAQPHRPPGSATSPRPARRRARLAQPRRLPGCTCGQEWPVPAPGMAGQL